MHRWLGAYGANEEFDDAVVALCSGPMIDLGCGPGCLVARLGQRGAPVVGGDRSIGIRASWIRLESARRVGPWFRRRAGELWSTWPYCERL